MKKKCLRDFCVILLFSSNSTSNCFDGDEVFHSAVVVVVYTVPHDRTCVKPCKWFNSECSFADKKRRNFWSENTQKSKCKQCDCKKVQQNILKWFMSTKLLFGNMCNYSWTTICVSNKIFRYNAILLWFWPGLGCMRTQKLVKILLPAFSDILFDFLCKYVWTQKMYENCF